MPSAVNTRRLHLPVRYAGARMPHVQLVDLRVLPPPRQTMVVAAGCAKPSRRIWRMANRRYYFSIAGVMHR